MPLRLWIYLIILSAAMITGIVNFKRLTMPFRYLTLIVGYTFIHEVFLRILASYHQQFNFLYLVYLPVAFGMYAAAYRAALQGRKLRQVSLVVMSFIFVISTINIIVDSPEFPSIAIAISSILLILLSILLLSQMLYHHHEKKLIHQSIFWMNTSIMVYWSINFIQLGLYSYFLEIKFDDAIIRGIHTYSSIIYYALLGFCIWLNSREKAHDIP